MGRTPSWRALAPAAVVGLAVMIVAVGCDAPRPTVSASRPPATSTTVAPVAPETAPPCSPARPREPGQGTVTLTFAGHQRDYIIRIPASYDGVKAAPVVFNFHGWGSTASQQLYYGSFSGPSDRDGFIVIAPDGIGQGTERHFNIGLTPSPDDDVAFVNTILDRVESELCVDPARVFSTGMSDGGAMTSVLACRAADRFAAFGPVAVVLHGAQCDAARPAPIAAFMGTDDPIVPFAGGPVHCCGSFVVPAAADSMAGWAKHNQCSPPTEERLSPMVLLRVWSGCKDGADVRFYIIEGGGHTWPGTVFDIGRLGVTTKEISASDTIWAFFQAHPMVRHAA